MRNRTLSGLSALAALFLLASAARAQLAPEPATVRIGVLSLFHPRILILSADRSLTMLLDRTPLTLAPMQRATIHTSAGGMLIVIDGVSASSTLARTLTLSPSDFTLAVPDKLSRHYRGALSIESETHQLNATVEMETELAVASIVASEAPPHAPIEALKAQAVASRSFLLATRGNAHGAFDACDTTHCQYLRAPPPESSPASLATSQTRGQVLTWQMSPGTAPRLVAAMYSRSCGGLTRVPPTSSSDRYPFYAVRCDFCRRHPELWSRNLSTPAPSTESERIQYNRLHGWSAIPGNNYRTANESLEGRGTGHGVGLCQLGAADLAARGADFRVILRHYFPNTTITVMTQQTKQ